MTVLTPEQQAQNISHAVDAPQDGNVWETTELHAGDVYVPELHAIRRRAF